MAAQKLDTTPLIDLAAIALSPALVMAMLGSFVVFVIEVAYQGDYSARLTWTFGFVVFGAVLVARISITESRARSIGFGVALGLAGWVAMLKFVDYPRGVMATVGPLLNLALIAIVLFAADRLTWDCTHFDPARKASGRGILASAGLDPRSRRTPEDAEDEAELDPRQSWLERLEAYRKRRAERPHTPGVTILYFALAALPLFAIGQSLVPVEDAATRRATLFLMAVYIVSALGLLVTTSLMGLRKYLEERGARVPAALTFSWLGLGAGLIVVFVAVGMVLPRPHSETALVDLSSGKSSDRQANSFAPVPDESSAKGEGARGRKQEAGGEKQGKTGQPKGGQGQKAGQQGQGKSPDGKDGKSSDQKDGKSDNSSSKEAGKSSDSQSKDRSQPAEKAKGEQPKSDSQKQEGEKSDSKSGDESQGDAPEKSQSRMSELPEVPSWVSSAITWIVRIVVILAILAGAAYFLLRGLAPFTAWARSILDWWRNLFRRRESDADSESEEGESAPAEVPFSAFADPFATGRVKQLSSSDLAGLTARALEAWGRGHGVPRHPGETVREFATRLEHEFDALVDVAFPAAVLHDKIGYAKSPVARGDLKQFARLWSRLSADPPRG